MEITKKILQNKFEEYNKLYFKGKITKPKFFLMRDKKNYGRIIYGSRNGKTPSEIWVSTTLNTNDDILKDTLIHEMIHQFIYEKLYGLKYQLISHGFMFRLVSWMLSRKYGIKVKATSIF